MIKVQPEVSGIIKSLQSYEWKRKDNMNDALRYVQAGNYFVWQNEMQVSDVPYPVENPNHPYVTKKITWPMLREAK